MPPEQAPQPKRLAPPVFITILILVTGIIGSLQIYRMTHSKTTNLETGDQTQNWKRYEINNVLGFSVGYPADWEIVEYPSNWSGNKNGTTFFIDLVGDNGVKMQIQSRTSLLFDFEKEAAKFNSNIKDGQTTIDVDGEKVTSILAVSNEGLGSFVYYQKVLSGPGGAYETYYAPIENSGNYFVVLVWRRENQSDVVDKILSSFKTAVKDIPQ